MENVVKKWQKKFSRKSMNKKNIAIFPAGTEIGLEIHNALRFVKDINLIGLASIEDHSSFVYKNIDQDAPYINDEAIIPYIKDMVKKYNLDYIFPAHDEAVVILTENEDKIGVKVIAPSAKCADICRYKSKTYGMLKDFDFTPKTFLKEELQEDSYPVFLKPDKGQGSNGAMVIRSKAELLNIKKLEENIICEYLPQEEYTVACVSDHSYKLLYAGQRTRSRVKTGISVSSLNVPLDKEVDTIANQISATLKMSGAWFFQVKKDNKGKYKLLEVSARIAGSMGLHRNQGINFSLLSIYIKDKVTVGIIKNDLSFQLDRAFISRYKLNFGYEYVYIDFDDTILLEDKVNPFMMHFLYQCKNKNIKLFLITRHNKVVDETLRKLHIDKNLFDEVIHIKDKSKKSKYIIEKKSIFIDDAFSERLDVHTECKIPVFDIDSIESLIDWRM
ncbi:MAG TPA: ATP-grasp domain-containing protein [Arcobacter sp.]|nr:ATP-grasp domain-containing protein [Arcobacter sp.]